MTILGGSDRKPGTLPASGGGLHPLATYKGVAIRVDGRPLVELLIERLRAVPGFGPLAIAGPARVYAPLGLGVPIVDTAFAIIRRATPLTSSTRRTSTTTTSRSARSASISRTAVSAPANSRSPCNS